MVKQLTSPVTVVKRDGRRLPFDKSKIDRAVRRCMTLGLKRSDSEAIAVGSEIARAVSLILSKTEETSVEEVQRLVIQQLWALGHFDAAEHYTIYREERRRSREKEADPELESLILEDAAHFPSPLQYFQFIDKYSRWMEDKGRRETWSESCDRVINFFRTRPHLSMVEDSHWTTLRKEMYTQRASPAMRIVQMAGPPLERCNSGGFNCCYTAVDNLVVFAETLYLLMQGCGVGFSVESDYVEQLPRIKKQKGGPVKEIVIEDSTEGWCDAVKEGMETWFGGGDVTFNYSLIRPEGAKLRVKGGRASGPGPLKSLLVFTRDKILKRQGKRLTPRDCHDIQCVLGKAGQLGGVRRASEIGLSDLDDIEIRDAKKGNWWEVAPWLDMANNSATYEERPDSITFMEEWMALAKSGSGERGIFNRAAAKKMSPQRRKRERFGCNPCLTGSTVVAVADGRRGVSIRELAEKGEDVPVYCFDDKGKIAIRWLRHPRITGYSVQIYKVVLDNGQNLRVTGNHKFRLRSGKYVEAKYLQLGDSLSTLSMHTTRGGGYVTLTHRGGDDYEHRLVAQFYAGRELVPDEHVHHKDGIKTNNDPDNLEILDEGDHLSSHSIGRANPRYSGWTNNELIKLGRALVRSLGRRFSKKEWDEFARDNNLPLCFSEWRRKTLGDITTFSKRCAVLEGMEAFADVDPRVVRTYRRMLDCGLDAEIVDGKVLIRKPCEQCGDYFIVRHVNRESGYCSPRCSAFAQGRSEEIIGKRRITQRVTLDRRKEQLKERQLEVYVQLKKELGREPQKKEWRNACKLSGVNGTMNSKSSPFEFWEDLKSAVEMFNHRVVSVELDGEEDVYNGTVEDFHNFFVGGWDEPMKSEEGSRKIVWLNNRQCGEIFLRSSQMCNLSIAIARADDTPQTLAEKVTVAAMFGTLQSTLTDFKYIRPIWSENCIEERLLGVDINGQMDCPILRPGAPGRSELLRHLCQVAVNTNEEWGKKIGINQSAAVTCVKPSGNSAAFFGCSSGMHARWSKYQVRRVRVSRFGPVAKLLMTEGVPYAIDPLNESLLVFDFLPEPAPEGTPTRNDLTAIEQFRNWLDWKVNYTEHNPSATIYVGPDEWLSLGAAVYEDFDKVGGLTFLPRDSGTYQLAPNEELTEEDYLKRKAAFPKINWGKLSRLETEDMTEQRAELACSAGGCEI